MCVCVCVCVYVYVLNVDQYQIHNNQKYTRAHIQTPLPTYHFPLMPTSNPLPPSPHLNVVVVVPHPNVHQANVVGLLYVVLDKAHHSCSELLPGGPFNSLVELNNGSSFTLREKAD